MLLLVGDSDDGFRLGLAEGRKEGFIDGQAGSDVGAVEGFWSVQAMAVMVF